MIWTRGQTTQESWSPSQICPQVNKKKRLSHKNPDVGSFLDFACPGGNVTDDGRTIQVQCIAKQLIGQPEPDYVYEEKYA